MLTRLLQRLVDVREDELRGLLLSFATVFTLFAGYSVIKPVRDEMGMLGGVRDLAWLFTGTLVATLAVHPLYTALVSRLPWRRFVPVVYRFFALNLVVFFVLLQVLTESEQLWVARAFYVWTSVFNLFVLSVFWSVMADSWRPEQGRRLFGFIALGVTLGGIAGSFTTARLVTVVGSAWLLLLSAVLIEVAVRCVGALQPPGGGTSADDRSRVSESPVGGGVLSGLSAVFRSPYLLGISGYMLLYTVCSTLLYFQQAEIVPAAFADDRAARAQFLANIDFVVNSLTIGIQLFLTGRIVRTIGVAAALALLPAVCVLGFGYLALAPSLAALAVIQVLRRTSNYSVARPCREMLYTVLPREQKYKAKQFVDTVVYRTGDQIGAWTYALGSAAGLAATTLAAAAAPIAGVWLLVGAWLGRHYRTKGTAAPTAYEENVVQPDR